MSLATQEHAARNESADALFAGLITEIRTGNIAGINDVVREAIEAVDRDPEKSGTQTGNAGTVDGSARQPDD